MICPFKKTICTTSLAITSLLLAGSLGIGGCAGTAMTAKPASASSPPSNPASPGQDSGESGSAVASIAITPNAASTTVGGSLQLTATVTGTTSNKSVTWKALNGHISSTGMYTAPNTAGTDTITATSQSDVSKTASIEISVSAQTSSAQELPAFPGAEGSAAGAAGGRGGVVIEVTNLNDSGTGSLRSCIETSGARTCVFRVGGVIQVSGDLRIGNPYLTIAGQTAPGGGIKLVGTGAIMWVNTHDVVIRYLSYDGNSPNSGPSVGSVSFDAGSGNVYNVIFDHVSGFHVTNKQLIVLCNDAGPVKNVTFQWNMTYKPDVNHPVGPMADATTCAASTVTNIDYHHNFFADTSHRLPLFNVKSGRWVNNIVYNWDWFAGLWQGATRPDIINNRYIPGSMNSGDNSGHPHPMEFTSTQSTDDTSQSMQGAPSVFLSGNSGPQGSDVAITARVDSEGGAEIGAVPSSWFRSSPLPSPIFPITADPASSLDAVLLPRVGNSQQITCDGTWSPRRQSEDVAMIAEYQSRAPGSLWSAPSGYATASVSNGTPCTESLHDGIPDQWKTKYGLSTTDPTLHKQQAPNGHTYLENYLNGQ
jgi:pectate lyase